MIEKNLGSIDSIHLIDDDEEEYTIEDREENEFILYTFKHMQDVNGSILVIDKKGNVKLIEAKKIKKIYIFTHNKITIRTY